MPEPAGAHQSDYVTIAELDPSATASGKSVQGIVTLIWPYSVSSQTFSILLAEPDFRLRRQRGQVRVRFSGSSAKALARCDVQSADHVKLSLRNAQWDREDTPSGTPGKGIEWQLRFEESVVLQIQREDHEPINLDIDHPAPSPDRPIRSPPPPDSPIQAQLPQTPIAFPAVPSRPQAWSTPAFLKRDRLSGNSYFGSDYDPFDEDDFRDNNRRKKTKYGRASNQWRFTEQDSSPESATRGSSPATESPSVNGVQNKPGERQAQKTDLPDSHERKEQPTEDQTISHDALVDIGVQVDGSILEQITAETRTHDALVNPVSVPQTEAPAPGHIHLPTDTLEVEGVASVDAVEATTKTTTLVDKADPSVSLDTEPPEQGAGKVGNDGATYPSQISQVDPSRSASLPSVSQDDQGNDVEVKETTGNLRSTESQDLPRVEASQIDVPSWSPGKSLEESVNKRLSQDEGYPSLALENSDTREIREESVSAMPATSAQDAQEPQENQLDSLDTDQDDSDMKSTARKMEGATDVGSPSQAPSSKIPDQVDPGVNQASNHAVPNPYTLESQTASLVENRHVESASPAKYDFNTISLDQDPCSAIEKHLHVSSDPSGSLPQQLLTNIARSTQDDMAPENDRAQMGVFVESDSEEDIPAQSPPPDILGNTNNEREGILEEDPLTDDESRSDQASSASDESELLFESETGDYYDYDMKNGLVSDDEVDDTQEEENQEVTAARPSSAPVQIISIDDSDEDDIDMSRSQTDGAAMSILHDTMHQSHAINSLLSMQKGGSPITSSPPPLPNTIPDSQVAVEVEEPASDPGTAAAEGNDVQVSSPSNLGSTVSSNYRRDSEEPMDAAGTNERFPTSSLSPEIPLENYRDPRLKNKVLTPNDTQPREQLSQVSHVSSQSFQEAHDLPTPQLTQNRSSDIMLPATLRPSSPSARSSSPAAPAAVSSPLSRSDQSSASILGRRLRKVKDQDESLPPLKPSPRARRVSNIPPSVSRWFAPRKSDEIVPDSRSQSPAESEESEASDVNEEEASIEESQEVEVQEDEELPSSDIEPPPKSLASKPVFQSTSPTTQTEPLPTSAPATGLRTSHAYYTPLSNLPSHFNTTTSTLSIVLASLPITRATSGPRDFYTTLFLTDPSSLQEQQQNPLSQPSSSFHAANLHTTAFTIARLFRPSRISLPQKPKKGDVILLRSCAVTSYSRTASLLSSNSSAWALFTNRTYIEPFIAGPPVEFGAEERGYVRGLWEWWDQLEEDMKEQVMDRVDDKVKKMEEKEERERGRGKRLKGMGLRLAPGKSVKETGDGRHELRDGKEWRDDVPGGGKTRTPRKARVVGVRHELRDGKGWVDGEAPRTSRRS
ncbi:MAG: hypothetical protein Q9169_002546 [Polycauliona sp. 2 TL-2023]